LSGERIGGNRIIHFRPIKDIGEFRPNLRVHTFPNPEIAREAIFSTGQRW
jgi:hypothetical protein